MKSNRFSCSGKEIDFLNLQKNDVVFLFNSKTEVIVGPFTVGQSSGELEKGALYSYMQTDRFSENIMVNWENVHKLEKALEKLPFLKNIKTCSLSPLRTQQVLTALQKAPLIQTESS